METLTTSTALHDSIRMEDDRPDNHITALRCGHWSITPGPYLAGMTVACNHCTRQDRRMADWGWLMLGRERIRAGHPITHGQKTFTINVETADQFRTHAHRILTNALSVAEEFEHSCGTATVYNEDGTPTGETVTWVYVVDVARLCVSTGPGADWVDADSVEEGLTLVLNDYARFAVVAQH